MNLLNPWTILGIAIAWAGSLVSTGYWQYGVGVDTERVKWQARENVELTEANKTIQTLTDNARKEEQAKNQALNEVSKIYQGKLTDAENEKDKLIAGVRNGTIVLRQPTTIRESASANTASQTSPAASGCNGETGSQLQDEVAEFLLSESVRADKIVQQLEACQAVVLEDRKVN